MATDRSHLASHGLAVEHIRGLVAVSGFYWVDRVAPQRAKYIWGETQAEWLAASPLSAPSLQIDTTDGYTPGIDAIVQFALGKRV